MVSFPHRKGSLAHVNVTTLARGKRTSRANRGRIQSAFHDVNGVDIPQKEPNLNHVTGLPVRSLKRSNGNEVETFIGFPFVDNVACLFSHNVYWLTDWLCLLVEPWRNALAPKNPASHYEQAGRRCGELSRLPFRIHESGKKSKVFPFALRHGVSLGNQIQNVLVKRLVHLPPSFATVAIRLAACPKALACTSSHVSRLFGARSPSRVFAYSLGEQRRSAMSAS